MTYAQIIYTVILIILGLLISYYKSNSKFKGFIATLVNDAESLEKTGEEKKAWVVNQIYAILPKWLRPILTKTVLSMVVQGVFDSMRQYAYKLLGKATDEASTAVSTAGTAIDTTTADSTAGTATESTAQTAQA